MKILFVVGECLPYIKTGGLADVVGAVPKILAKRGHDVRVVLPGYSKIDKEYDYNNLMNSLKSLERLVISSKDDTPV